MRLVRVRTRALFSRGAFSAGALSFADFAPEDFAPEDFPREAEERAGRSDFGADSIFFAATIRPDDPTGICIASKKWSDEE